MGKYLFWLLLVTTVTAQAQNIRGKVCLEEDKSPVPFATVALVQMPDSIMITGVITLTDGGYLLEKVKPGEYFIRVSFVGYETSGKSAVVAEGDPEVAVDTIFLRETTATIGEVTVTAERLKGRKWLTGLYMPFLR